MGLLYLLVGVLAVIAGVRLRSRGRSGEHSRLTDDMIRQIESDGWLVAEADEPLDWEEIREEEERFFGETWDEPEEL
jgi:hypothetical protein